MKTKSKLRDRIAKIFTDAHTPYPELKVIKWPDDFADEVIQAFSEELDELEGKEPLLISTDSIEYQLGYTRGREEIISAIKEMKENLK